LKSTGFEARRASGPALPPAAPALKALSRGRAWHL